MIRSLAVLIISLGVLYSCNPKNGTEITDNTHNSRNSLDWMGVYEGKLPCEDCSGIQTMLTLNKDETYSLEMSYLDGAEVDLNTDGKFEWSDDGNEISLLVKNKDSKDFQFKVIENGLIKLDRKGKINEGHSVNDYILGKNLKATLPIRADWHLTHIKGSLINVEDFRTIPEMAVNTLVMEVTGSDGCNQFRGIIQYVDEKRVTFSKMMGTRMACENMEQINEINRLIGQVTSYEVKENRLLLFDKTAAEVLRFKIANQED